MENCSSENCIRCSVKNCVYHTEDNTCNAGRIEVGNSTACSCSETCCDTFKWKD